MKKNYLLIGFSTAAIVAAVAVLIGARTASTSLTDGGPGKPIDTLGGPSASSGQAETAAIAKLRAAHAAHPGDAKTTLALANVYVLAGRYADAARLYAERLKAAPRDTAALTGLAMAWHAEGQDLKALTAIRRALAVNPSDQLAHYDLGLLYFSAQKTVAAKTEWQRAAEIDPKDEVGRDAQNFVNLLDGTETPTKTEK